MCKTGCSTCICCFPTPEELENKSTTPCLSHQNRARTRPRHAKFVGGLPACLSTQQHQPHRSEGGRHHVRAYFAVSAKEKSPASSMYDHAPPLRQQAACPAQVVAGSYSGVTTRWLNPPISQSKRPCHGAPVRPGRTGKTPSGETLITQALAFSLFQATYIQPEGPLLRARALNDNPNP